MSRFEKAIAAIDAANAGDPVSLVIRGVERPKEQAHAEMMSDWVGRLSPDASEALLLAARAHHIRRWEIPRSSYPEGRAGYLRWRRRLHAFHAEQVAPLLTAAGYGADDVQRVQTIVKKQGLGSDPEVQVLEDALCLVFLETQFADIAARLGDDKTVDVTKKTLVKMSDQAKELALEIPFSERERGLLARALAS